MYFRSRLPAKAILLLSEEIATQFCQKLAQSNSKALTDNELFNQALENLLEEIWRIRDARRQEILEIQARVQGKAALAAPQAKLRPSSPPMTRREVLKALNLVHEAQIQVACKLGWLHPVITRGKSGQPKQAMYLVMVEYPLTQSQRRDLEKQTFLNQQQSAEFLDVAYHRFIQIRNEYNLKPRRPQQLFTGNARFYRLCDLMELLPKLT